MATERLSPPVAPLAYERSAWLDAHDQALQVEGDPETPEAFAQTYDFSASGHDLFPDGLWLGNVQAGQGYVVDRDGCRILRMSWHTAMRGRRGRRYSDDSGMKRLRSLR